MRRPLIVLVGLVGLAWLAGVHPGVAQSPHSGAPVDLPGLTAAAQIWRDTSGMAHIRAANEHDLFFLQGYVHAEDRLFQMDVTRREASGRLAELLGPIALASDVTLRTLGVRRAAERSVPLLSPRGRAAIEAYAAGVNEYVRTHPLPAEYGALELTRFEPWTVLDTMTVAKVVTFQLSFDMDDIRNTQALVSYQAALGGMAGAALFSMDLWRSQPFDPACTVPDAIGPGLAVAASAEPQGHGALRPTEPAAAAPDPVLLRLTREYLDEVEGVPLLRGLLDRNNRPGSNQWAIAGRHTTTGAPMIANDPHLALGTPSTFYPIHLSGGDFDVTGSGFAGVPFVIVGHNRWIAWGATVNPMDVTDVYQEQLVPDATSPSGFSSLYLGNREWVIPIPEQFSFNRLDGIPDDLELAPPGPFGSTVIPTATLIVPRRNQGPIVSVYEATGAALSVQYTGWSGTREVETFLRWDLARGLDDFVGGLQYFDCGGQSLAYADTSGNIAYFTSSEMPIREDLQAQVLDGTPPWLVRNGQGGNEWLPVQHPQPGQAVPFEILPFDEMPHVVNPPAGWFVSANNDPAGTTLDNNPLNQLRPGGGIYYLSAGYDAGFRAGRITGLVRDAVAGGGRISFADMQAFQSNVALLDAEYFVPFITRALQRAQAGGADPALAAMATPGVVEAVSRLAAWDFTTPTGIREGYDAADENGQLADPTDEEKRASVAATIYSVWRGQFIRNTIDATLAAIPLPPGVALPRPGSQLAVTALAHLLRTFDVTMGTGASGLSFFNVPGVSSPLDQRDIVMLASLEMALTRLAGEPFRPAFATSTDQNDYNWGKLHRIVFRHPLGGPFSIPPAGGAFPAPLAGLPGIPTDGGFGAPDASEHNARAQSVNDFMFGSGPVNRFVAEAGVPGVRAESVWPGGTSGVLGNANYANLLPLWLTNDTIPLLYRQHDLNVSTASVEKFVPGRAR